MTCLRFDRSSIVCVAGGHWAYWGEPNLCGEEGSSAYGPQDIRCPKCRELFRQSQEALVSEYKRLKRERMGT